MSKALISLLLLSSSSCERKFSPEFQLTTLYLANEPITCFTHQPEYDNLWVCRDGKLQVWVCSGKLGADSAYCIPALYAIKLWEAQTPTLDNKKAVEHQ